MREDAPIGDTGGASPSSQPEYAPVDGRDANQPATSKSRLAMVVWACLSSMLLAELALRLILLAFAPTGVLPRLLGRSLALLPFSYDRAAIDQAAAGQAYVLFNPDLGWVTSPGVEWVGPSKQGDVRYRHNSAGLRSDREYAPAPPVEVRRLAAYGDSFTYCETVELSDCWTDQLERMLPSTEVLNFGVPAFAPDQAWLRYQRGGAASHPCAVLIGHMVENINRVVNRFRPFYYPPPENFPLAKPRFVLEDGRPVLLPSPARRPDDLKDPAWVEAQLGPHDYWYFPGLFASQPFDWLALARLERTAHYRLREIVLHGRAQSWPEGWARRVYQPGTEGFEVLSAVLAGFAEDVRGAGATPVVLVFPTLTEVALERDGRVKPHAPLLARLHERHIPTVDLTDALGEEARSTPMDDLVSGHYRPMANAVVAHALADEVPRLTAATCGQSP